MNLRTKDLASQFDPIVGTHTRLKHAKGLAKQTFNSHLEMMLKHFHEEINGDEIIDTENLSIQLVKDGEVWYHFWMEIEDASN